MFVSGIADGSAKIWDVRIDNHNTHNNVMDTILRYEFIGLQSDVNTVKWFPDDNAFITACDDGICRLFDLRTKRMLNEYKCENKSCVTTDVDFSKSGKWLYVGYENNPWFSVFNTVTGQRLQSIRHTQRLSTVTTSTNGYGVATGCWDGNIRIWA